MYRQSPSRNHRSKGINVKSVLQICLLVAVCFWLIYQVKHSHDKKKEFDESDAKALLQKESNDELIRLGRKDIQTRAEGTVTKNENHDELSEEEETDIEEVEDNKHEEDKPEDKKVKGREEDNGTGGGDDETDEHEQEISDVEVDGEPNLVNGEEREDGDDNEIQETDSENSHGQAEKESAENDPNHDGDDRNAHEAREENYKADDASSAVTHDTQIVTNENDNEHVENLNQHLENILEAENKESDSEQTNKSEDMKDLEVEGGEVARDGHHLNVTTSETKVDNSGNVSSPNNTLIEGSDSHLLSNSTTDVTIENHDLSLKNVTEREPELSHVWGNLTESISAEGSHLQTIDSEGANNSILTVDGTHLDSNSTGFEIKDAELLSVTESSNSPNNVTLPSESEDVLIPESSMETGNNTESSAENKNEVEGEKSDTSDGTDESLETTLTENPEEVQQDAIDGSDPSISMEEKDVRTDLDTLPEIQTEGTNSEDAAAE